MPVPTRVLDTHDVEEARRSVAAAYCEHRLSLAGSQRGFHAVQTEARVGAVRAHRLRYGADLTIDAAPLSTSVLVTSPRRGVLTVTARGGEHRLGPGDVVALDPDAPFRLRWGEGCELATVQVPRRLLAAAAGPVRLDGAAVVRRRDAASWRRLVALLEAQGADPGVPTLLVDRLEALVAASVVAAHARAEGPGEGTPGALAVRRVLDLVHDRADEPLTTSDLARAAHLSVRGLQVALRRHLDVTPSELLRAVRLERAHDELVASSPARTTVEAVAHRWGFVNAGRFARYHHERYGTLPAQVLRS